MSRGKLAAALAVAAFVCLLAPALAQYADTDLKYGRQDYKADNNDYNGYNNDYNGYNNDYNGYNNDGHDDSKWEGRIQHTEYLVCRHCGEYSALANSVLLNTFNFVKVYGSDLDTSLCLTLHIVYVFILIIYMTSAPVFPALSSHHHNLSWQQTAFPGSRLASKRRTGTSTGHRKFNPP